MARILGASAAKVAANFREIADGSSKAEAAFRLLADAHAELSNQAWMAYTAIEDGQKPDGTAYAAAYAKVETAYREVARYGQARVA